MSLLRALFAAAFVGFATLLAITALLIGGEAAEANDRSTPKPATSRDDPDRVATAVRLATEDRSSEPSEISRVLYGMALLGAIVAASTTLLLRAFATGRKTTTLLGLLLGPLLPVAIFAPQMLREGKAEDLAGLTVMSAIAGLVAGILDAGRRPVAAERGRAGRSLDELEIGAGNRT